MTEPVNVTQLLTTKYGTAKIRYTRIGFANTIGDVIELNHHLQKWPELHDRVLEHEFKHLNHKAEDGADLTDWDEKVDKFLVVFVLRHPSTWPQFFPIWIRKSETGEKVVLYDKTLIVLWLVAIIIFAVLLAAVIAW